MSSVCEDTKVVFPLAAKLFAGDYPGSGFEIPFTAPDRGSLDLTVDIDGPLADLCRRWTVRSR
ncbi:MAG: hypothetical protein SVX43_03535 [Cyanobacteriota bacterium]|nr:hypothetical protein [Cyanobacteriota bacterium]